MADDWRGRSERGVPGRYASERGRSQAPPRAARMRRYLRWGGPGSDRGKRFDALHDHKVRERAHDPQRAGEDERGDERSSRGGDERPSGRRSKDAGKVGGKFWISPIEATWAGVGATSAGSDHTIVHRARPRAPGCLSVSLTAAPVARLLSIPVARATSVVRGPDWVSLTRSSGEETPPWRGPMRSHIGVSRQPLLARSHPGCGRRRGAWRAARGSIPGSRVGCGQQNRADDHRHVGQHAEDSQRT